MRTTQRTPSWPAPQRSQSVRVFTATAIAAVFGGLVLANGASAAPVVEGAIQVRQFPAAQIATFLFLMLGPFKIIGPFANVTRGADPATATRIALLATLFASLILLIAAFLGERILSSYGIPVPVLALSAGIILFLVALRSILEQLAPPASHSEEPAGHSEKSAGAPSIVSMALTPLAYPTIVTPYGIAALIVFVAFSADTESQLTIGAIVLAIMGLNIVVMILPRHIHPTLGVLLPVLGAVLGIVQVALGLQIINNSLRALGIL